MATTKSNEIAEVKKRKNNLVGLDATKDGLRSAPKSSKKNWLPHARGRGLYLNTCSSGRYKFRSSVLDLFDGVLCVSPLSIIAKGDASRCLQKTGCMIFAWSGSEVSEHVDPGAILEDLALDALNEAIGAIYSLALDRSRRARVTAVCRSVVHEYCRGVHPNSLVLISHVAKDQTTKCYRVRRDFPNAFQV